MSKSYLAILILVNVLFSGSSITIAQNDKPLIDSLTRALNNENLSIKQQVQLHTQLCKEYAESNPETGIEHIDKAFSLLQTSPNDTLYVYALIAKCNAYSYMAQYNISTPISIEVLTRAEKLRDTTALLDGYNNLGIDFLYTEDYSSAHKYFTQFIDLSISANDSLRLGHGYNNLGLAEYYLGNEEEELINYVKAQKIFENINEKEGLGNTLLNIGTIYTSNSDHKLAHQHYNRALKIFDEMEYMSAYANVLQSMSEDYMEQGLYLKAEKIAFEALDIVTKNELKLDVGYIYDLLQKIYFNQGDYKKSHEYLVKHHEVSDEIFNEEKSKQLKELYTKYETSQKEAEIERLGYDNEVKQLQLATARNQIIAIATITLLLIIGAIVFYVLRNRKIEAERIAQEHQFDALKQRLLELQVESSSMELTYDLEDLNNKLHTPLTEREHDTLTLSLTGKSNSEIAEELFVSVNTVKFHLRNIYQKLGVANKKEAKAYVIQSS